jgi:hypothetical protein
VPLMGAKDAGITGDSSLDNQSSSGTDEDGTQNTGDDIPNLKKVPGRKLSKGESCSFVGVQDVVPVDE